MLTVDRSGHLTGDRRASPVSMASACRDQVLQLLVSVLHDDQTRCRTGLIRVAAMLVHQEPLTVWRDIVRATDKSRGDNSLPLLVPSGDTVDANCALGLSVSGSTAPPPSAACQKRLIASNPRSGDVRHDRYGGPVRLQAGQVDGDRTQRTCRGVHEMPARQILPMTAAADEHFACSGIQVHDDHLRRVEATSTRGDRKEDRVAAGQQLGPLVVGFPLRAVDPCENSRVPPRAGTRRSPVAGFVVAKMTVSSGAQAAPRSGPSRRASVTGGPPVIAPRSSA